MINVLLDVNVLVAAMISSGVCSSILDAWLDGEFDVLVSPRLLAELEEVLARKKFEGFVTAEERTQIAELLRSRGILIEDRAPERVSRDPDDDYLIALARDGGAAAIVSGDKDLLVLKVQIPVITPRDFLEALRRES